MFQKGEFLFRYLGNPVTVRRLARVDCDVIVDIMLKRLLCWTSRHLSYATRVTLVNAVLLNLHTYWAQIFVFPKLVMMKITQLCRDFLWEGKEYLNRPPPIVWSKVCMPRKHGGLGLRDCLVWNYAELVSMCGRWLRKLTYCGLNGSTQFISRNWIGGVIVLHNLRVRAEGISAKWRIWWKVGMTLGITD